MGSGFQGWPRGGFRVGASPEIQTPTCQRPGRISESWSGENAHFWRGFSRANRLVAISAGVLPALRGEHAGRNCDQPCGAAASAPAPHGLPALPRPHWLLMPPGPCGPIQGSGGVPPPGRRRLLPLPPRLTFPTSTSPSLSISPHRTAHPVELPPTFPSVLFLTIQQEGLTDA